MTMRIARQILAATVLSALLALPAAAQTIPVEGAIEAVHLYYIPGKPGRVRAVPCKNCESRVFRLADNATLVHQGHTLPLKRFEERQGRAGTVIYSLKTGRVVRIVW